MNREGERITLQRQLLAEARLCARAGSPMYAHMLEWAAQDAGTGGPCLALMTAAHSSQLGPLGARFLAGLHALVLSGQGGELAAYYPSVGGDWQRPGLLQALRKVGFNSSNNLQASINYPIQPNEVGRAAALLVGFHVVHYLTKLPLMLLEIGSCAGLNLYWDRFFYAGSNWSWGYAASPVKLTRHFRVGNPIAIDANIPVVQRLGCDKHPLDIKSVNDIIRMKSFIWADQAVFRFKLLDAACRLLKDEDVKLQQEPAATWLKSQSLLNRGVTTVVFHTIVWEYMPEEDQNIIRELMRSAGACATQSDPIAWLQLEPSGLNRVPSVRLLIWPHSVDVLLARCQFDGSNIEITPNPWLKP